MLLPLAASADGMGGIVIFGIMLAVIFLASLVALSFLISFVLHRVGKLSLRFDILFAVLFSILFIIIFTYAVPLINSGVFLIINDIGGAVGAFSPYLLIIIGVIISSKYIFKDWLNSIFVHALFIMCSVILLISVYTVSLAVSYKIDEATDCKFIGRDFCYNDSAHMTQGENYCAKIKAENPRGSCYYDLAIRKSDENLCRNIGENVMAFGNYSSLKERCLTETAQLKNDWKICTNLENSAKEKCIEEFMDYLIENNKENQIKDKALCSSLPKEGETFSVREDCDFNLAVNNLDSEGCYDSIYQNECLFKIALNTLDAGFCQKITDINPSRSERNNTIAKNSYDIANQCLIVLSSLSNNKDLCDRLDARGKRADIDLTASKDFCLNIDDKYPNMVSEYVRSVFGENSEEYEQIRKR